MRNFSLLTLPLLLSAALTAQAQDFGDRVTNQIGNITQNQGLDATSDNNNSERIIEHRKEFAQKLDACYDSGKCGPEEIKRLAAQQAAAGHENRAQLLNSSLDKAADYSGDRVDARLDARGNRIDERLDLASERQEALGHEGRAEWLDRAGDKAENHLDRKGDRIDDRRDGAGEQVSKGNDRRKNSKNRRRGG